MLKKIGIGLLGILVLLLLIAMCTGNGTNEEIPNETVVVEVTRIAEGSIEVTQEVTVEVTRLIEVPVTVTFTPGPSPTPSNTPTPTITPSPTVTPTPFSIAGCRNLSLGLTARGDYYNLESKEFKEKYYLKYDGLCVHVFSGGGAGVVDTNYISLWDWPTLASDDITPQSVLENVEEKEYTLLEGTYLTPKFYSSLWGVYSYESHTIALRRIEPFEENQQPVAAEGDGFWLVGQDAEMAPGQWRSIVPPGEIDDCYWARTNPNTGDIRDNHFGQAGGFVRVYEGDLFESSGCGPWVFVK